MIAYILRKGAEPLSSSLRRHKPGNELVIEREKEIETPVLIHTMLLPVLPE